MHGVGECEGGHIPWTIGVLGRAVMAGLPNNIWARPHVWIGSKSMAKLYSPGWHMKQKDQELRSELWCIQQ